MSDHEISPKLIKIEEGRNRKCIVYEEITSFSFHDSRIRPNMSNGEIISVISNLVKSMHSLGYGHGDLIESKMKETFDWDGT